jgi:hypothetical protein
MGKHLISIDEIKPNPNNPRTITPVQLEKLIQSIKQFPQMLEARPLVIDENNMVLGGNMRLRVLKELGYMAVPVIKLNELTEEQKREFVIKDNLSFGEWDWDTLLVDWEVDTLQDWGLYINMEDELSNHNTYEGADQPSKYDKFVNSEIKRMFLVYDNETFDRVIEWFEKKQEQLGVEDNNQVILKLMENEKV